ncbi:MAG: hypothetical protein R2831_04190 [Chitinophagaceae bacterium]
MKLKTGLLFIVCCIVISSCTQEYICQCAAKYKGMPNLPDSIVYENPIKDTKKNAIKICEENSTNGSNNGVEYTINCRLY